MSLAPDRETTKATLLELLAEPMAAAAAVDPSDPVAARAQLERTFPTDGPAAARLRQALSAAVADGTICDRGDEALKFSRLSKPDKNPQQLSVDVVWMTGQGPRHRHVNGELNLCFAVDGEPRFDGHREGWVVFPPGSAHVPTVTGGRMLIAYFLPGGAMEWL
jgi:hypothetical protein